MTVKNYITLGPGVNLDSNRWLASFGANRAASGFVFVFNPPALGCQSWLGFNLWSIS